MEQSEQWSPLWRYDAYGPDNDELLQQPAVGAPEEQIGRHARADADEALQTSVVEAAPIDDAEDSAGKHRAEDEITEQHEAGRLERLWNGIKRNKVAVAAGVITVASMAANPIGDTIKSLAETATYVGPGMIAAEAAWIGGAAMMLAAIGKKIINPLKIHQRFKEIPDAAAESNLFKAGLAINTAAAVAEFVIPTIAVTTKLPVESWGILSFAAVDLLATVALRKVIWKGMHRDKTETPEA
jgi:hypothetical protein